MNKEKIKKSYDILKDNLSVILLVPTVLGGIWQLLELSSMSASFIRFFSFTQLIADGLLILFVFTIFFISYRIVGSSFSAKTFKFDTKKPPSLSYGVTLTLLVVIASVFLFPSLKSAYHKKNMTIPEVAIMIPTLTMLIGGAILGIISILENLISRKSNTIKSSLSNKWIKGILEIFFKLFILFFFFGLIKFIFIDLNPHLSNFRRHLLFPDKLLNKEFLDKKLIKEQHLKFKPKLIYFNDKYFFYEILDDKKNQKILIVDFSTLIYK